METLNLCSLSRYFHDEAAAWELLESLRWPNGPECPHCGETDRVTYLNPRNGHSDRIPIPEPLAMRAVAVVG